MLGNASLRAASVFFLVLGFSTFVFCEEITFPIQAQIVDVTQDPYNAKGDGKTDDTEALQRALDSHPNGNYIIYLPKGTYLISRTLAWPKGADTTQAYRRTIMQGQDALKTIIRLAPKSQGFGNPEVPKAVIYTGLGPAPRYRNSIHDLTVTVGPGNPGAVGIRFNAANQGTLENVHIIAEDKHGSSGLDMAFAPYIGPLLVKNLEVDGFDIGILTGSPYNGMTLEHITLSDQNTVGILNQGQMVTIRALFVKGHVTGIHNYGPTATMTLIDGKFSHNRVGDRPPAIVNEGGVLFARNISCSGFASAIQDDIGPGNKTLDVFEYTSHPVQQLCSSPKQTLRLPVAETPVLPWGAPGTWVAISGDYGGTMGDGTDDSKAIQTAIDDGAEVIFFNPGGRYTINKDVIVRKNVRRIIGVEAKIDGTGKFVIADGVTPQVVIERFATLAGGIRHRSNRTLILKDIGIASYDASEIGAGDLFLEDVTLSGPMNIYYQNVWARQLHIDFDAVTQVFNHGGNLWILGLTSTRSQKIIHTHLGGQTEILGAHIIAGPRAKTQPMFTSDSSSLSIAGLRESAPVGNEYPKLISEDRPDQTPWLLASSIPQNASGGRTIPLYVGFIPKTGYNNPPIVKAGSDVLVVMPKSVALTATVDDDGRGLGLCSPRVEWSKAQGPGRLALSHPNSVNSWASFSYAGVYDLEIKGSDGVLTSRDTLKAVVWDRKISTRDNNGNNIASGRGADASISEASPSKNYGRDPELPILFNPGKSSKIYCRFDLSDLPGPIADGALQFKVKPRKNGSPTVWNVYALKESASFGAGHLGNLWSEDSLTWTNAPGNNPQVGGGIFDEQQQAGGGADPQYTTWLGTLRYNERWTFGYYFQSKALTDALKKAPKKLLTLILTSQSNDSEADVIAGKENLQADPPSLYLNYIDPNRSVGGDIIPGGYRMSPVEIDPVTLNVTFTLMVAAPQVVRVEVFNEQGNRVLLISDQGVDGEKVVSYHFDGHRLETGNYRILVTGEAFQGQETFVLLN